MKTMVCIGGVDDSLPTLQFGTWFATKIATEILLLYVEKESSLTFKKETEIAFEKLLEWNLDLPAIRILRMAMKRLEEVGLLKMIRGKPKIVHDLRKIGDAWQLCLKSFQNQDICFKTRQGNIVEQILQENRYNHSDLLIVGSSRRRRLLPKIVTFVDSSILVIKNLIDHRYEILIATDGSESAHRAEYVAIKTAQYFERRLTFLSVVNSESELKRMEVHLKRMSEIAAKKKIELTVEIKTGNAVEEIIKAAGDKKIIFVGESGRNLIKQYFLGSKVLKLCRRAKSPIFIVKKHSRYK
jgi:nucleotide-binding universal stress UspA family protein